jgi:hypothetical protein
MLNRCARWFKHDCSRCDEIDPQPDDLVGEDAQLSYDAALMVVSKSEREFHQPTTVAKNMIWD